MLMNMKLNFCSFPHKNTPFRVYGNSIFPFAEIISHVLYQMYFSMFAFSYCLFNLSTNHLQPALLQAHLTPFSVSTFFFLLSVFNTAIGLCNIINQIQSLLCSKPSNMSPFYSIANEVTANSLTLALLIFPSCHLIYSSHINHRLFWTTTKTL